jgi:plastocyanin
MTESTVASLRPYRRDVMKSIGAGGVLSAVGGTGLASGGDEDHEDEDDEREGEGDDGNGDEDDGTGTVHRVETTISGPPTNPNRPADFFYQPTGLHVRPGDVVKFVFHTPDHNVVSYNPAFGMRRRMPTGVGPFSSPLLGWRPDSIEDDRIDPPAEMTGHGSADDEESDGPVPDTWLHAFETAGVYDILCSPHETFGMAMRVVVGDVTDPPFETSDPEALPDPRLGPVGLARETLTDPALEPARIVEEGTVHWQSLEANQSEDS